MLGHAKSGRSAALSPTLRPDCAVIFWIRSRRRGPAERALAEERRRVNIDIERG
jgi:hypothetical protein